MLSRIERRLNAEMGISCPVRFAFSFIYKASFNNGLTEHEFDHVYFGFSDQEPHPSPDEVKDWRYINVFDLEVSMKEFPHQYTEWFKILFPVARERYLCMLS